MTYQAHIISRRPPFTAALLFLFIACFMQPVAHTQERDGMHRDYYQAQLNRNNQELLRNVEKHHLQQGIDRMNEGRFDNAVAEFDFILRYYPNHPRALLLMGELSRKMDKPGQAHEYFAKALNLFPHNPATYSVYGIFLQRSGDLGGAIEQYSKALERNPNHSEVHYNIGLAYLESGEPEKAREHAVRAYELGYPLPGLRDQLSKAGHW